MIQVGRFTLDHNRNKTVRVAEMCKDIPILAMIPRDVSIHFRAILLVVTISGGAGEPLASITRYQSMRS
jgi:hypothetical protein